MRDNNSPITLPRICGAIVLFDMVYMFYAGGTHITWTVFFVFLVLFILLNTIEDQHKEIQSLRSPKEELEDDKSSQS